MSHSNVTKEMFNANVNSEGKEYHEHGEKIEKKKHEPAENADAKYPTRHHHGHDNQFHKDIKGSVGSGSSEKGDRKAD